MNYVFTVFLMGLVVGSVAVASNPAPYYGALGLVVAAGSGCGVLVGHGGSFLSLVLFLIYLGGMLVVFAYSVALAAEPFPVGWWDRSTMIHALAYLSVVGLACWCLHDNWSVGSWNVMDGNNFFMFQGDTGGVAMVYSLGGWVLIMGGWVLLLTLLVVLELTRGLSRGALRAV